MPTVPVPFVATLLLLILLVQIVRRPPDAMTGHAVLVRPVVMLVAACTIQSALIGLRWGYDVQAVQFLAPVLAAALPPLLFVSFDALARSEPRSGRRSTWLHVGPPLALAVLVVSWRGLIDLALIVIYVGYALAIARLGRRGPDGLGGAVLEGAVPAYRALQIAVLTLVGAALVDALVAWEFEWAHGERAAGIVGLANTLWVLVLGVAAAMIGPTPSTAIASRPAGTVSYPDIDGDQDQVVLARIDDLMRGHGLYRDADLTLGRLARRAGVSSRRISAAVNRTHARNVSQYINGFRVAEACRLLTDTDSQVSQIMFEAGFQTKSNFNREFRRVTGMSPLDWRARKKTQ